MPIRDFGVEVARGKESGHHAVNKYGSNPDVDTTSDPEDLWSVGGLYTGHVAFGTEEKIELASSDVADDGDPAGTGAHSVTIWGLDGSLNEQSETLVLDGTTAVTSTGDYLRVHRMRALAAGSGQENAGAITATGATSGAVFARIDASKGSTQMAIFSVPTGHTLLLKNVGIDTEAGAAGNFEATLRERTGIDTATPAVIVRDEWHFTEDGPVSEKYDPPKSFAGPCDVWLRIDAVSASNTPFNGRFGGVYIVNSI